MLSQGRAETELVRRIGGRSRPSLLRPFRWYGWLCEARPSHSCLQDELKRPSPEWAKGDLLRLHRGSGDAELGGLAWPSLGKSGLAHQMLGGELSRLSAVEDLPQCLVDDRLMLAGMGTASTLRTRGLCSGDQNTRDLDSSTKEHAPRCERPCVSRGNVPAPDKFRMGCRAKPSAVAPWPDERALWSHTSMVFRRRSP